MMKPSTRKKLLAGGAAALAVVMAVGGTLAWKDYSQHKTNEANGTMAKYTVRLVENFKEVENWKTIDPAVTKEIRVMNQGTYAQGFSDVYVRIQLKEYMEIKPITYTKTNVRYLVKSDGTFAVYAGAAAAQTAYPGHTISGFMTDVVTGQSGYFVQTQQHDENGEYGDYVTTAITKATAATPVIPGSTRATNAAATHHQVAQGTGATRNQECDYPARYWDGRTRETEQYVQWLLNNNYMIKYSDWMTAGGQLTAKWIIDDRAGINDAWIYWGQPLTPGTQTANFLNQIKLQKQPDGDFYYAIHTELQAVSIHELGGSNPEWGGAPPGIIGGFTNNSSLLSQLSELLAATKPDYDNPAGFTTATYNPFKTAWDAGKALVDSAGSTQLTDLQIQTAIDNLRRTHTDLEPIVVTPPVVNTDALRTAVTNAKALNANLYVADTAWTALQNAITAGESCLNNWATAPKTQTEVDALTSAITSKMTVPPLTLKPTPGEVPLKPVPPGKSGYEPKGSDDDQPYSFNTDFRIMMFKTDADATAKFDTTKRTGVAAGDAKGYIQLADILASDTGTNYNNVSITVPAPYTGKITIGQDYNGAKSIVLNYLPTNAQGLAAGGQLPQIPVTLTITQGINSSQITIILKYAGIADYYGANPALDPNV